MLSKRKKKWTGQLQINKMGDLVRAYIDSSLVLVLEDIKKEMADTIKKKYSLDSVCIYGTLTSQALGAIYWSWKNGKKSEIPLKIKKKGNLKGVLHII